MCPFMWDYTQGLAKIFKKVKVIVAHDEDPKQKKEEHFDNIHIERFTYFFKNQWQFLCYRAGIPQNLKSHPIAWLQIPFYIVSYAVTALKHGKDSQIIYCHWTPSIIIGLFLKLIYKQKIIAILHGSDLRMLPKFLNKILLNNCDATISGHEEIISTLQTYNLKTPIKLVRNFINEEKFHSTTPKRIKKILWVGRLDSNKNPFAFIDFAKAAEKTLPNLSFTLVGDGPLKKDITEYFKKQKPKNISFLGPRSDVDKLLKEHDASFFSTQIDNIWSTTLLEAILSNSLCILNPSGQTTDFFECQKNCIIYNNTNEAIHKLSTIQNNQKTIELLTKNAKITLEENGFTNQSISNQHQEILKRLCKN